MNIPFHRPKLISIEISIDDKGIVTYHAIKKENKLSENEIDDLISYSLPAIVSHQIAVLDPIYSMSLYKKMLNLLEGKSSKESASGIEVLKKASIELIRGKNSIYPKFLIEPGGFIGPPEGEVVDLIEGYCIKIYRQSTEKNKNKIRSMLAAVIGYYLDEVQSDPFQPRKFSSGIQMAEFLQYICKLMWKEEKLFTEEQYLYVINKIRAA